MLTNKKQSFADLIIAGVGKAEAAARSGYSAKTAANKASGLMKDPDVIEYLTANGYMKSSATQPERSFEIDADALPMDVLRKIMTHPESTIDQRFKAAKALLPLLPGSIWDAKQRKSDSDLVRTVFSEVEALRGLTPEEKIQRAQSKYMQLASPTKQH